jgi:predicted transcriptional regulator
MELTKAEEQIMQVLWDLKKGFVKELLPHFPDPKPAYNTVSTIIRILEKKGFVGHRSFGKSHQYYPKISRDEYSSHQFSSLLENYYNNSFKQVVSHFSDSGNLDLKEMDEIIQLLEELKNKEAGNA